MVMVTNGDDDADDDDDDAYDDAAVATEDDDDVEYVVDRMVETVPFETVLVFHSVQLLLN